MFNNSIERLNIKTGDVVLVVYRPRPYSNYRKTIIHYHGYGSDVEKYETLGQLYALHGYQFVLVEMENHGVRGTIEDPYEYSGVLEIMNQSFAEYWDIKDLVLNKLNGDVKNLAISGHSMGGMIAMSIFARDTDIKFALIYNGIADFNLVHNISHNLVEALGQETIDEFMKFNPVNYIDNFDNRDALIMIGGQDDIVKPNFMEDFKDILYKNDINSEKIHFVHYEDVSHAMAYKMVNNALKYTNERMA